MRCHCGTPLPDKHGAVGTCTRCQALAQRDGRTPAPIAPVDAVLKQLTEVGR